MIVDDEIGSPIALTSVLSSGRNSDKQELAAITRIIKILDYFPELETHSPGH